MRTSLFLSSLFAATLVTGAALADNHHPVEFGRAHGDTMDKTYRVSASRDSTRSSATSGGATARSPIQARQNERVNCSVDSADCAASHGSAARGSSHDASNQGVAAAKSGPNPISSKSNDRVSCNEAGEGCQMSSKAAKAAGKSHQSPTEPGSATNQAASAANRHLNQAYAARTACNEGEECSFSSKDAKKIWRTESFKHGTASSSEKGLDFSNAHADLKARMEAARYKTNAERQGEKTKK